MADYRLREYRMYDNGEPTEVVILATTRQIETINAEIQNQGREYRLRETERG